MKPIILHISNDYPDPLQPDKTRAVLNLIEGTPQYRHIVYSLNRVSRWSNIAALPFGEDRIALAYGALPKGLFWDARLKDVADWIYNDLQKKGIVPDLIEAHKFTVEGLIGLRLAEAFSKPLICDIQGDSDTSILTKKTSLRGRYKEIAKRAALVFPYGIWAVPLFENLAGLDRAKCVPLPVVPGLDTLSPAPIINQDKFISIFNIDSWQRKNIENVMLAMKNLMPKYPNISIDIYGRGKSASVLALQNCINKHDVSDRVKLMGAAPNNSLPEIMKNYVALLVPSKRETYGLVFAEALFSGLPILYSKNRGIYGYVDEQDVGYACDPQSVADITLGITHLLSHQASLKNKIASLQSAGNLNSLRRLSILKSYADGLDHVVKLSPKSH